jgi:hypothetical protein
MPVKAAAEVRQVAPDADVDTTVRGCRHRECRLIHNEG